ncbi:hypothetical protein N0V90_011922 [Kalmusia sp. IMI 367209]|nr:hypothetical protein N0V90_011922 [Kalmusia sp. IMI 367209]
MLFGMVYYSQLYYLPLFFQNARRMSPTLSAVLVLPIPCAQMTASIISGQYISRMERYGEVIWAGFFIWTLGAGLTCVFDLNTSLAAIIVILVLQGIGVGFVFQPTLVALQAHCTKAQRAVVISNRNFLRSLGGAVGLAISATALQNSLKKALPQDFAFLALSTYDTPNFAALAASPVEVHEILKAYASASRTVFIMNVPFIGLCLLGCIFVKDHGLRRPDEMPKVEEAGRSDSKDEDMRATGAANEASEKEIGEACMSSEADGLNRGKT